MSLRANFRRADEAIREEKRHIGSEKRMIEHLEAEGHSTDLARRTLVIMEHVLKQFERHRRILLERMGFYSTHRR